MNKKGSKRGVGSLFLIILSLLLLNNIGYTGPLNPDKLISSLPSVILNVNGVQIKKDKLDAALKSALFQYSRLGVNIDDSKIKEIVKQISEDIVSEELLVQFGKKNKYTVDKKEVTLRFDELQAKFPSKEAFKGMLKSNNLSASTIKEEIERKLLVEELIKKKIASKISVGNKEEKDFYDNNPDKFLQGESVKASHILIEVPPHSSADEKKSKRKQVEAIIKELKEGKDFADLAKKHSNDTSAARGGDLGYFVRGQMVPNFEKVAFDLKIGEVSSVVETQFGYHIIKKFDQKAPQKLGFNEVKDRIHSFLLQQKTQKGLGDWISELRKSAKVENFIK